MHVTRTLQRAAAVAVAIGALAPGAAHAATVSFDPGDAQAWTVPAGVSSITVDLYGSAGQSNPSGPSGGSGAHVQTTLSVTAGQTFQLFVGGYGTNGGGSSVGFAGGGATDVRVSPYDFDQRVAVAAGGGGAAGPTGSYSGAGGNSGASGGGTKYPSYFGTPATGGGAGTSSAGGAGGGGGGYHTHGQDGAYAAGGAGDYEIFGQSSNVPAYGGGGGGGLYGGGGGGAGADTAYGHGAGGGGGGGSSLVPAGGTLTDGDNAGLGHATITYNQPPPVNTAAPKVTGSTQIPNNLTTNNGGWDNADPNGFTYKWQRCDSAGANCDTIADATSSTYTLAAADDGHTIRSIVYASNSAGKTSKPSKPTKVIVAAVPVNTAAPKVTGSTVVHGTLSSTTGTWDNPNAMFTYKWQRCDTNGANCAFIDNAESAGYTTVDADVGHTIRSVVYASTSGGKASKPSKVTKVITAVAAPTNTAAPQVSGGATVGDTLSTTNGSWDDPDATFTYIWQRCNTNGCTTIPNQTSNTYTTTDDDVGYQIRSGVYATNGGGSTGKASRLTSVIQSPNVD